MKAPTDIIHRMELAAAGGIHDTREWRALEALARTGGEATVAALEKGGRMTLMEVSAVLLSLGGFTLRRFDPHPFVTLEHVNLHCLKSFSIPQDAVVKLTGKGWQTVQLMGYGSPALIVPECHNYATEIANPADPEGHCHGLQLTYPLTHWELQPAIPSHEA